MKIFKGDNVYVFVMMAIFQNRRMVSHYLITKNMWCLLAFLKSILGQKKNGQKFNKCTIIRYVLFSDGNKERLNNESNLSIF